MPDERSGPNLALAPALTLELEREHESCGSPPPHGALRAYCVPTRRGRGAIEYCRVGRVLAHARARACVRARVRACVRACVLAAAPRRRASSSTVGTCSS